MSDTIISRADVTETAMRLGVHQSTLFHAARRARLSLQRVGERWTIPEADADAMLLYAAEIRSALRDGVPEAAVLEYAGGLRVIDAPLAQAIIAAARR